MNNKAQTIDFDKIFENYVLKWYNDHSDEFDNVDELEDIMPKLYDEWANSPSDTLGGISPKGFFDNIRDPKELVQILIGTSEGDGNPCTLLLDRISGDSQCLPYLYELIKTNASDKTTMFAVNLIEETGGAHPLDEYVTWLTSDVSEDLKEIATEILCENANAVKDKLFAIIGGADTGLKTVIAEILVNADKDERTYNLLIELFNIGDNIPLYAGYIGKYSDERAVSVLYRALDNCNYLEFLELKNAIERMGGVVDDNRDFSEDVYYSAIKGLK